MDIDRTWLWGGAGLVVGLLVGIAIAGDGREARETARRAQEEMARSVASVSEAVGRIDQSVAELGGRVAGIETAVATVTEQQAGGVEGLRKRLEEVGAGLDGAVAELGGAVSELGDNVTASVTERLEGLRTALDAVGGRRGAGSSRRPAPEAAPAAAAGGGEPVAIGEVVAFGDGAARVFLSGVDRAGGTARVAINGPSASSVTLGEPAEAGTCTVTLTGFTETGATFEGDCGGSGQATAPAEGSGEGTAVTVGAAATIADGKLRVFLSRIDAEAGTASVAVNGPQVTELTVGQPVEAGGCTVTLTGVGDGEATIDATC
ncbi:MAG TPA: hypothetical protein VM891_12680 [Amaricoccus sp.]|nr:hypothetical protein [Amaricoccus sp.]